MTPSSSSLFSEIIKESLTKVKENLQIKLLSNLSSQRGGKQSASTTSSSGRAEGLASSSSTTRSSSRSGHSGKRRFSASPLHKSKVFFDTSNLRSSTPKNRLFGSRSHVLCRQSRQLSVPLLVQIKWMETGTKKV